MFSAAGTGHLLRHAPDAVLLAHHERLNRVVAGRGVIGAAGVGPARGAVTRRPARHRGDAGVPADVQRRQAGHLHRRAPHAVGLARHEPLPPPAPV